MFWAQNPVIRRSLSLTMVKVAQKYIAPIRYLVETNSPGLRANPSAYRCRPWVYLTPQRLGIMSGEGFVRLLPAIPFVFHSLTGQNFYAESTTAWPCSATAEQRNFRCLYARLKNIGGKSELFMLSDFSIELGGIFSAAFTEEFALRKSREVSRRSATSLYFPRYSLNACRRHAKNKLMQAAFFTKLFITKTLSPYCASQQFKLSSYR